MNIQAAPARFLDSLLADGLIAQDQLTRLNRLQAESGESAIRLLVRTGLVDAQSLATEIARHYSLPLLEEEDWPAVLPLRTVLSPRFLRDHHVLPIRQEADGLVVAVSDPGDEVALKALRIACEQPLKLRVAPDPALMARLERLIDGKEEAEPEPGLPRAAAGAGSAEDEEHLRDLALDAPVIDLVNRLFREASATRATDLHIEPARGRVIVRRRVDGLLQEAGVLPADFGRAAVSRVKILTQLNIAERRLPQDGRARIKINDREYDIRVATMPTIHGESIAIRFLNATHQIPELNRLGLTPRDLAMLKAQAQHPYGLIIVTGPTGSGKTTTLAAVLSFLNDPSRKILSIEDPVEYQVDGVNQIQIRSDIGLTFATTLRSILRLDPDIIMVGEMRDSETAKIGVNSALTGHLVLTTLHTNSAAGAITRLLDLDVQAFLIASTLRCVIAQRLVRKLCPVCRQPHDVLPDNIRALVDHGGFKLEPGETLWKAVGCDNCSGSGYQGRAAIFELLIVDEEMRKLIQPGVNADTIATAARAAGMVTMVGDGFAKCKEGLTTVEEIARVAIED
jgi:general secretion pathway protein E